MYSPLMVDNVRTAMSCIKKTLKQKLALGNLKMTNTRTVNSIQVKTNSSNNSFLPNLCTPMLQAYEKQTITDALAILVMLAELFGTLCTISLECMQEKLWKVIFLDTDQFYLVHHYQLDGLKQQLRMYRTNWACALWVGILRKMV